MSSPAALLRREHLTLGDGPYFEQIDARESSFERALRALLSKVPRPGVSKRRLRDFVALVNKLEPEVTSLADADLRSRLQQHAFGLRARGFADDPVAHAFSVVREGARRALGMRHHDVQLIGGWALLNGMIAEMETGEGKTLVATLAACVAASTGAATHVITVNDYLAERDAKSNQPLFELFGLSVGTIIQGMSPDKRREQYLRDIVYVSNKEIVFDYLKDRIAIGNTSNSHLKLRQLYRSGGEQRLLLRGLHVAIVDEADSVLIDEARTPLIISQTEASDGDERMFATAIEIATELERDVHYSISEHREVTLLPGGEQHLAGRVAALEGVWHSMVWRHELIEKALSALYCFQRDQHYILADGKVQIVDEFTGRVMPDRSWEHGLHQMIEAKEGCEPTGKRKTLSRMTYQRFFRRYLHLCGMTGTAEEVRNELRRVYELRTHRIPTHKPSRRRRLRGRCLRHSSERWEVVATSAAEIAQSGRAVLVGTRSVEASEALAQLLTQRGIEHRVLNARQDKTEADVVAEAGRAGRITVATNMAGRGTDIKLDDTVRANGGLHVILTEFHESGRIDRQLFGRCARQGEAGSAETIVSLEDEIFDRYVRPPSSLARRAWPSGRIPSYICELLVRIAQMRAEHRSLKVRLDTLKQDRKLQAMLAFSGGAN
jgi:preprotein translocase subunit SecA